MGRRPLRLAVVKHVTSNAIVLTGGLRTVGVGAGQMSRVDSGRTAIEKAHEHGHSVDGAVLASELLPSRTGALALEAGVTATVQPGGSKREDKVIEEVERKKKEKGFTGRLHLRH